MYDISSFKKSDNRFWFITPKKPKQFEQSDHNSVKKIADITATSLWLTAVGFAAYKTGILRKHSPEYIYNQAKRIEKQYSKLENIQKIKDETNIDKLLENQGIIRRFFTKILYNLGQNFQNSKAKMGDELYNNLINSVGKLFIMPLVILTSIIGKNESSKEEKFSVIIREPLSVLATFTLQGAFDKLFNVYMPKILSNNIFETKEIRDQVKKHGRILVDQFENIKYNPQEAKRLFLELTNISQEKGGLKGILSERDAHKLITIDAFEPETYESYIRNFEKQIEQGIIESKDVEYVRNKFKIIADSIGNYELAKIKPKIAMNIITVVILSRIFLNVIHGKAVKLLNLNENKEVNNE
ncbi:hypothetical protein IJ579_04875 [bacterium]|nr:hypothetical protein [bacterium]